MCYYSVTYIIILFLCGQVIYRLLSYIFNTNYFFCMNP
uniref:Uncharacterized protein n=1 Tax=Podoviridae sp. ct2m58 TaxID=2827721 RepID=A0A8S5TMI5_9CAUD|nr:MAG TPA: hypothetical protein [Podoviridae sp. ct2m58]